MGRIGHLSSAVAIVGVTAALTACTAPASGPSPDDPLPPLFGHVHALDVDLSTGETYASTHHGVWLLPTKGLPDTYPAVEPADSDAPRMVADRAQDTMGFTVARPGLLLGSGHPAPNEQLDLNPPNLGLIRSTDRAETWETISLRAEADFHDLETAELPDGELRIYGYDSTEATLLVSDDTGKSWTNAAPLDARDFAVDPTAPDRIYATTAQGLLVSQDRGHAFAPVKGAPPLFLVTVTDTGEILGIDVNGTIQRFDGTSWTAHGQTAGTPEAFTYVGGKAPWLLIADERGVIATDDYGKTAEVLLSIEN